MSKSIRSITLLLAGLLAVSPLAFSQNENEARGQAVVTILPKKSDAPASDVSQQTVQIEVNGKQSQVTSWLPLRGTDAGVELILLIEPPTQRQAHLRLHAERPRCPLRSFYL
jgi:hypothetical protein